MTKRENLTTSKRRGFMWGDPVLRVAPYKPSSPGYLLTEPHERYDMADAENTSAAELAAQINGAQDEQVASTESEAVSPASAEATREERLLAGKYKSVDELESSYLELQRNYTASRQSRVDPPQSQTASPNTVFDKETELGITNIVEARLARERAEQERERAERFATKHAEELKDPLLRGAVLVEIQAANERGEIIDQELALTNAKQALETRLNPKVEAAKKEAFEEGSSAARRKEQAGAIGGVSSKTPEVDPENLNAEDYAVYMGLK